MAGFRIAEKTVRNIKGEKVVAPATELPPEPPRPPNPVAANFVHHVWMMDVTEFKTLFGAHTLYFAAVFDGFSRLPLTGMAFAAKPGGAALARLFRHAVAAFGPPKYLITDRGGEFIARVFRSTVERLGAKHRLAAVDNIHATARLERFWKTLKEIAHVRLLPPIDLLDLEQRLRHALAYTQPSGLIRGWTIERQCRRSWVRRLRHFGPCHGAFGVTRPRPPRFESASRDRASASLAC